MAQLKGYTQLGKGGQGSVRYKIKGIEELPAQTLKGLEGSLQDVAYDVERIAATRTAPVDTGNLRRNITAMAGFIYRKATTGIQAVAKRILAATDYAYDQHETTHYNHPKGGQDHYLTEPIDRNAQKYLDHIVKGGRNGLSAAARKQRS